MDGAGLITQCLIPHRSSFTYRFKAETVGTHFWHAHQFSRFNGAVGSLVIRQAAPDDIHSQLYDYDLPEHVIIVQDWINQVFVEKFSRVFFFDQDVASDSLLINGKGRYKEFFDKSSNKSFFTPRNVFHVAKGKRYRFRTISNNVMDCSIQVSIDHHNLTIIASDGASLEPVQASAFGISSGERFDFVLDAKAVVGKYWMRIKGFDSCREMEELALVVYEGSSNHPDPPNEEPYYPSGVLVNPFNMKSSPSVVNINELNSAGKFKILKGQYRHESEC